jgi:hypothetical protein
MDKRDFIRSVLNPTIIPEKVNPEQIIDKKRNVLEDIIKSDLITRTAEDIISLRRGRYNDVCLDLSDINPNYNLTLTDDSIDNPFIINSELVRAIRDYTKDCETNEAKARAIFDWIETNIEYGHSNPEKTYGNTRDVLINKKGICGEMAFLDITMNRSVNLRSSFVYVMVDNRGKRVEHACALVEVEGGNILVDPAYHTYDIHHQKWEVLSDAKITQMYNAWRRM